MGKVRLWLAAVMAAGMACFAQAQELVVLQVAPSVTKEGSVAWQTHIGAKVFIEGLNVRGGVGGKPVKLVSVDQGPDVAAQIRELAAKENAAALFGTTGTESLQKLVDGKVLEGLQLPLVGPRTGASALVNNKALSWVFFTRPSYEVEVEKVLNQFATIGVRKFIVLHSEDPTGREMATQARDAAAKHQQSVEAAVPLPRNASQLPATIDGILAKEHQAVLLAIDADSAAAFLKYYRQQGGSGQVVAMSSIDAMKMAELATGQHARGTAVVQVSPNPRNDAVAVVREFTVNYRKYGPYTETPTQAMMDGYLAAKVLAEGLRRGGPRAGLQKALQGMNSYDVGGVVFSFGAGGRSGSKYLELSVVDREGRISR